MALNIPNTGPAIDTLMTGVNTGSNMFSRMMQPILDREKLKQQQNQFLQNLALQKEAEGRQQSLMPYLIQQYQDTHRSAASEAEMKELYRNVIQDALTGGSPAPSAPIANAPGMPGVTPPVNPQMGGGQPNIPPTVTTPMPGTSPNPAAGLPTTPSPDQTPSAPPIAPSIPNQDLMQQEHELRAGNPRLAKLDSVAGLIPGIPKPVQHITNGMIFTTYPSGRMTVQQVQGAQTPGEKTVSAKEASKIRDQATALANSANLVQQGYDLLDNNKDLTGIGSGAASMLNLSNNPELGKFMTVTGKLQAELGKYAASRGGIQAVKWAGSVKPSQWKPEDYNYGMFEGIQKNLQNDYNTLNAQYKAATGQDLPVPLPQMSRKEKDKERPGKSSKSSDKKVTKVWDFTNGKLS